MKLAIIVTTGTWLAWFWCHLHPKVAGGENAWKTRPYHQRISPPELPPLGPARKELSVLLGHLKQLREHLLLEARLLGVIAR